MDTGRYTVTDAEAYRQAVGIAGDAPDEVHVHDASGDIELQELWHDRDEGRFATVDAADGAALEAAVSRKEG